MTSCSSDLPINQSVAQGRSAFAPPTTGHHFSSSDATSMFRPFSKMGHDLVSRCLVRTVLLFWTNFKRLILVYPTHLTDVRRAIIPLTSSLIGSSLSTTQPYLPTKLYYLDCAYSMSTELLDVANDSLFPVMMYFLNNTQQLLTFTCTSRRM